VQHGGNINAASLIVSEDSRASPAAVIHPSCGVKSLWYLAPFQQWLLESSDSRSLFMTLTED
jgi:hypothetical protein